jgi:acyl-CoA synthetase (NDP forming)
VPFDIDLAVLIIPPRFVPEAVADCARKGAKGVVITSEGFGESGEEGRRHQEAVSEVLKQTGMRAFGPNTLGIVNTDTGLTTSYFADQRMLRSGSIGFAMLSEEMFRPMAEVIRENQSKPVFVSLLGSREDLAATEDFLRKERIPVVPFPETAIQVFARTWRYVQMNGLR